MRVLASLGSECANTVYELPHVRIRVIASGTVRRCSERLTPSVQAHPELFTPDGCGSPLPGRTMPPAPRPHVRAARATGLSFLRGLVCEPEVVLSHNHSIRACGVFAPPSPGHPKAKRPGCSRPRRTDGGLKHESYLSAVPCSSPSLSAAPVRRAQTRLYRTLAHATFRPRAEYGTRPDRITTAGEADR